MPISYPTSLDSLTNPTAGDALNSPSHAGQHDDANDAIKQLETKLGTGASVPTTSGHALRVTGSGATAYGQVAHSDLGSVTATDHRPTLPTYVAAGTAATGTGAVVPGLPAGHTTNDILLLFVQSDNQAVTAPAGYAQVGPQCGTGTAAAAAATRLAAFWKRDGGSESDPTVADTGDHTYAVIIGIRGCPTSGDPFHFESSGIKSAADTSAVILGGETTVDNCLIVQAIATATDIGTARLSGETNADLGSLTERVDISTTDGNGGGIGIYTGTLIASGPFGSTTATEGTSTVDTFMSIAMLPSDTNESAAKPRGTDFQVFQTAGTDTWTKPTGAKSVEVVAIGGGGSGAAGGRGGGTSTEAGGGGGGGGGMHFRHLYQARDLAAPVSVVVGAGGAAVSGIAVAGTGTNGNDGTASTLSANSQIIASAAAGKGGIGGAGNATTGAGGAGGSGGGTNVPAAAVVTPTQSFGWASGVPAAGGLAGAASVNAASGSDYGGGGGGGGAGWTTNAVTGGTGGGAAISGAGGSIAGAGGGGGGGNAASGGNGNGGAGGSRGVAGGPGTTSGQPSLTITAGGCGGDGGAGKSTSPGTTGGAGGATGGGGGGGGALTLNSGTSGGGGAGATGVVVIITYF